MDVTLGFDMVFLGGGHMLPSNALNSVFLHHTEKDVLQKGMFHQALTISLSMRLAAEAKWQLKEKHWSDGCPKVAAGISVAGSRDETEHDS